MSRISTILYPEIIFEIASQKLLSILRGNHVITEEPAHFTHRVSINYYILSSEYIHFLN